MNPAFEKQSAEIEALGPRNLEEWLQENAPKSYAWEEWQHDCQSGGIVQRVLANGAKTYAEQCQICGKSIRIWKKQEISQLYVGVWKNELVTAWREAQRRAFEEGKEARQKEYRQYLTTKNWKDKRSKVLARANNLCEGCGDRTATEVHHLTYRNVGDELLFELVALCSTCHSKAHTFGGPQ